MSVAPFYFIGGDSVAQYDGSIRINTKISTKNAKIQLVTLENSMVKTADKIDSLRSKLDSLKNTQIPTQEYKEIISDISKAENELGKLIEKQSQMQQEGKDSGVAWDRLNQKIQATNEYIEYAKTELQDLVASGNAFTIGDPAQEEKLTQQLRYEEERLSSMNQKRDLLNVKIQAQADEEARLAAIKENATVADQELVDLLERRKELLKEIADLGKAGVTEGYQEYDTAIADLSDVQTQIDGIRSLRERTDEARASYKNMAEVARWVTKTIAKGFVDIPIAAVKAGVNGLGSGFQKLGSVARNVAVNSFRLLGTSIKGALTKAGSLIGNMVSKLKTLGSAAKKSFSTVNSSAKKSSSVLSTMRSRLKEIVLSFLVFDQIRKIISGITSSIKEGFGNLYKDNERFQNSVNELKASVLTLKNSLAAAFRPLVDIAIPYIQKAADKLTELLNKVGQFTAAITGQKTYTKAIKQTADAFNEAAKAASGYLSPLDEINKYSDGKSKEDDEDQFGQMFEELPVEQKFMDIADKVKDVLKDLFAPIKEAWNREGKFVIDSWKYGLKEIGKLLKDIGRDFLKVWKQPATIAMLQDILHIFGDIGLIAGNLASKFREAWNYNNTGLHILENIRDIFAVIIHNIREAADYTVEWTKTLDFTPLLQGVERLTASLVPFFDFLSGTLADFYTQFLLPLASWTLSEEGIPRLLNILADFMESVNWEGLRTSLASLYSALEPYAEAVGTGLINFIERMKEYGVDFLNFLPGAIQNAADALRNGDLPAAFEEFGHISGEAVRTAFAFIKETIESINWGEIGTLIASFINGIDWNGVSQAFFGSISSAINAAIDLAYGFVKTFDFSKFGESVANSLSNVFSEINLERAGGLLGSALTGMFDMVISFCGTFDWTGLGDKISDGINGFFAGFDGAKFAQAATSLLSGILDTLIEMISTIDWAQVWRDIIDFLVNVNWLELIGKLVIAASKLIAGIAQGLAQAIVETDWGAVWNNIVEAFKNFFGIHSPSTLMSGLGGYLIEGLKNGILGSWGSLKDTIGNIASSITDKFKSILGIHSPSTVMDENGVYIMEGLENGIGGSINGIIELFNNLKASIVEILTSLGQIITVLSAEMGRSMLEVWKQILSSTVEMWKKIADIASRTMQNMRGILVSTMANTGQSWSNQWRQMEEIVAIVCRNIEVIVLGMVSNIRNMLSEVSRSIESTRAAASSISSGEDSGQGYSARSYSMRSMTPVSSPYAANPAFAALSSTPIPKLATGAVIPANREFLAVLGDQKHGTNIEAPLETIKQASMEAVAEVLSKLGISGNIGSNPQTIIIKQYLDGKQVAESVVKEGKIQQMSTGNNMFLLGTT